MKRFMASTGLAALLAASTVEAQDPKTPGPTPSQASPATVQDTVTLPKARVVELKNGVRLLLVERHNRPMVSFSAKLRGGALADPEGKEGLASLTLGLLEKGAGARNAQQFAETVDGVGGVISLSAGRESLDINGQFMSRDTALMVELLSDMLVRPRFEQAELDKLRERRVAQLIAAKDSNAGYIFNYFQALHFGTHPYGRPANGSESSLAGLQRADVLAYAKNQLGGDRLILAVVGDFDSKQLAQRLEAALGGWTRAATAAPVAPPTPATKTRRVLLVDKPGSTQTYICAGNTGISRTDPERTSVGLANTILGGGPFGLLMKIVRTDAGLSYSVGSGLESNLQPGSFFVSSFTKRETTAQTVDLIFSVLDRYRQEGVDDTLLASAKRYTLGTFLFRLETQPQIASKLSELSFYGLDASDVDGLATRVLSVDQPHLKAAIQRLVPPSEALDLVLIGEASALRDVARKYGPVTEMSITEPRFFPAPTKPTP